MRPRSACLHRRLARRGMGAAAILIAAGWIAGAPAAAADLPYRHVVPVPRQRATASSPRVGSVEEPFYRPDRRPASSNGYYGYYGYDITGVPYEGLYSADVTCLRSVRTAEGYRTIDVCRP